MNMKKTIAAVLSAAAVLSLAGCSGKEDTSNIWNMLTSGTSSASSSAGSTSTAGGTSSAANGTSSTANSSSAANGTSSVPQSSRPEESSAAGDPTESKPAETNPVQVDWSTVPELDEMDIDYEVKEIKDIPERHLKLVTGLSDEAKKNGVVIIKAYYGDAEYIKIPQTIAGKNCIAVDIDVNWGDNAKSIKYPDGFVCIYSNTSQLRNCGSGQAPNVTSVSLPDNLEYICGFDGLTSLEEITLPKKLKTIDDGSFSGLQKLKSVTIGENVERIGSAFYLCTALEKVNFPKKLNGQCEICASFSGCSSLKSIELPEGADLLGGYDGVFYGGSFSGCTALEKVFLPNTVTVLPGDTFSGCTALKEINLPSSLKTMECGFGGAFVGCTSLEKLDIPDSVATIGSHTFSGCTSLKEIIIPDGVTTVGRSAFDGCNEDIVIKYKGKTYNSKNVEKLYEKDLSKM